MELTNTNKYFFFHKYFHKLLKKKFQVVDNKYTCSQNLFFKEDIVAGLSMYCIVKLKWINNYNINFSLVDVLRISALYLEKC